MVRLLWLLALALAPATAAAGTRATFVGEHGARRTLVIADNGDFEIDLYTGQRLIVRDDRAYIVEERLTGPIVMPLDELAAAAPERAAAAERRLRSLMQSPEFEAARREMEAVTADLNAAAGEPPGAGDNQPQPPPPALVERPGIEVHGRVGRGYYYQRFDDGGEEVFAVVSDDPALASIGAVFRRAIEAEDIVARASSEISPPQNNRDADKRRILASGTPIQYYNSRLRDVEQAAVPSITLPAEPETGAALRARLAAEDAERYAPPAPERMASRAMFADGRLYLVAGDHRLLSLAEGEQVLTRHDLGEPVLDACVQGDALLALTGAPERGPAWTLRRLRGGQWPAERSVPREQDEPVALACEPEGAFLLTSRRFIDLTQPRPGVLRLRGEPVRALVAATVHVTPQAVFVGLNAGEWGGGLRRIDRRSGRIETIERNATGELCDGPLNTNCDPVQGLANIPWRPNCVAAAIGVIHMMAHGRLTMVCPDRIEQLYAAVDGEPDTPERAEDAAQGSYGSVAFFGLAATGNSLLAIGHNGLHRIEADGSARHEPLPRFTRVEGMLVSFALPDVVLVVTGINGRASMSGSVPIMAVRQ